MKNTRHDGDNRLMSILYVVRFSVQPDAIILLNFEYEVFLDFSVSFLTITGLTKISPVPGEVKYY